MIDFYTWKTPNGQKIAIMLEEIQLPYKVRLVDLTKQEQFKTAFLKINPNNKIPAIVDHVGSKKITIFESGAILFYLAEKTGKFLPKDLVSRAEVMQWLMFQISGVGPMLGQLHHFLHYAAEKLPYAIERYTNEAKRLYRVMDNRLEKVPFFVDEYSIADMAIFPWVNLYKRQRIDINEYSNVKRWFNLVGRRPAVKRGLKLV